jgi:competence protein ComEA
MLERYKHLIFGAVIVAILSGVIALLTYRPAPVNITILPPPPTLTPAPLQVYVTGAVATPDTIYALPAGSRAQDAVTAAGGFTAEADRAGINLAQLLVDGQQIHIPKVGETVSLPAQGAQPSATAINVNTATLEQLMALPDISAAVAQAIVDYRAANGPFRSMSDLDAVSGIGEKTLEKWQGLIMFQ